MGAALSQQEALSDSSSAGDESERLVVPHKFDEIIAQGTTATADELEDQMYGSGIYLAGKTKVGRFRFVSAMNSIHACFLSFEPRIDAEVLDR